ncbi:DUF4158 domain-containing protein [Streptomyces sp. NPDC059104]|uniref:DUF4158 domain-containing protein n=1 Tax=Streptomyces sp. NPDC059104 TaxID=3346729 RepID=UPI0036B1E820
MIVSVGPTGIVLADHVIGGVFVASVERTAYPRFKRVISDRELARFFVPDEAEVGWAERRTHGRPESLLTLLVLLKSCGGLGYFPGLDEVPELVVAGVRAAAGLPEDVAPVAEERTAKRYRSWIREYLGLGYDPALARKVAAAAMEEAAPVRASAVDLVNVALEEIVRAGLELPGLSTLDRMAASARTRVEGEISARIAERVDAARPRLAGLLVVPDGERRSPFDVIKEPGRRATRSRFRQHGERVDPVDGFGDAARARVRDEFVVMLSKRVARHANRAQEEPADLEQRHKASTERLLVSYRNVLTVLKGHSPDERAGPSGQGSLDEALAVKRVREVVEGSGGFDAQLAEIEALSAYRGGNWTPLVGRFFRPDRPTMFKLAQILTFVPTSRDRSLPDALEHAVANRHLPRELISDTTLIPAAVTDGGDPVPSQVLDLSFASQQWRTTVYGKDRPGMLVRRHFEAMGFTHLVEELRCGDMALAGAEDFGGWTTMLLPWVRGTLEHLARAGADIVDAHLELDLVRSWGNGSVAAVDGTMMDSAVDNLLAETSIRYGGYGGIAHHLLADTQGQSSVTLLRRLADQPRSGTAGQGGRVPRPPHRENVLRFGDYTTDQLHIPPPLIRPRTPLRGCRRGERWNSASMIVNPAGACLRTGTRAPVAGHPCDQAKLSALHPTRRTHRHDH